MSAETTFAQKAPAAMTMLMRRFGLNENQAAGVLGNFGRESLGLTVLREIGQPPGRGGYGYGQWTGPRRALFLNWCAQHRADWKSDAANWGYLCHELAGEDPRNSYAYVLAHLHEASDLEEATEAFMHFYERPGVPALADRIAWAKRALASYRGTRGV